MLKLKLLSGVIAVGIAITAIHYLPFKPVSFSNTETYISQSKETMQRANSFILSLEHNLDSANATISTLKNKNETLENTIKANTTTIENQANEIKALEKELKNKPSTPSSYMPPIGTENDFLPKDVQNLFNSARKVGYVSPTEFDKLMLYYYTTENDYYWTNYYNSVEMYKKANKCNKNLNAGIEKLTKASISIIQTSANYPFSKPIFSNKINSQLANTQLSSNQKAYYDAMLSTYNEEQLYYDHNYMKFAKKSSDYRANILAYLYEYNYWNYIASTTSDANLAAMAKSNAILYQQNVLNLEPNMDKFINKINNN